MPVFKVAGYRFKRLQVAGSNVGTFQRSNVPTFHRLTVPIQPVRQIA